jgi:hypothetical protein
MPLDDAGGRAHAFGFKLSVNAPSTPVTDKLRPIRWATADDDWR